MRVFRKAVLLKYLELSEKHPGRATVYYREHSEEIEHLWTWGIRNLTRWHREDTLASWKIGRRKAMNMFRPAPAKPPCGCQYSEPFPSIRLQFCRLPGRRELLCPWKKPRKARNECEFFTKWHIIEED